jgi:hypothetical protein
MLRIVLAPRMILGMRESSGTPSMFALDVESGQDLEQGAGSVSEAWAR